MNKSLMRKNDDPNALGLMIRILVSKSSHDDIGSLRFLPAFLISIFIALRLS